MPPGAKPAAIITWKPIRSASRSMSREKLSWPWMFAAWVPATTALIASGLLLRGAASTPMISAARLTSERARVARDAARDVALRDVRHLVAEHRSELVARAGDGDQAEVHADVAAGQGECVDARVAHEERLPGEALVDVGGDVAEAAPAATERLPDRLQVLEQQRVVDVVRIDAGSRA